VEAERRQVTVLFADMVGFTSFSERSGEEAAFTLMRSLSKLMDEAVREQGGVVRGFTGDGIMAVFGVPVALEDAPLRACRAALGILHRLKETGPDLEAKHRVRPQLRIGLNTGASVVGKVEESADAGVTVLGDTVNFAARLQTLAEPDTIFMSDVTHRIVQGIVDANYVGEHAIKGKTEPAAIRFFFGDSKSVSPRKTFRRFEVPRKPRASHEIRRTTTHFCCKTGACLINARHPMSAVGKNIHRADTSARRWTHNRQAARRSALNDAPHLNTWLGRFAIPPGSSVLRSHLQFVR
jgi:class 3 adenylate cyclase